MLEFVLQCQGNTIDRACKYKAKRKRQLNPKEDKCFVRLESCIIIYQKCFDGLVFAKVTTYTNSNNGDVFQKNLQLILKAIATILRVFFFDEETTKIESGNELMQNDNPQKRVLWSLLMA